MDEWNYSAKILMTTIGNLSAENAIFRKSEWVTVTHQTSSEILFPFVKYDKSESDTY